MNRSTWVWATEPSLLEGLRIASGQARGFSLQLRGADVVPLSPSEEYAGFVSDRALRADTRCAVLCKEAFTDDVARYIETITGEPVQPRSDETLPAGWRLFTDVRPVRFRAPSSRARKAVRRIERHARI